MHACMCMAPRPHLHARAQAARAHLRGWCSRRSPATWPTWPRPSPPRCPQPPPPAAAASQAPAAMPSSKRAHTSGTQGHGRPRALADKLHTPTAHTNGTPPVRVCGWGVLPMAWHGMAARAAPHRTLSPKLVTTFFTVPLLAMPASALVVASKVAPMTCRQAGRQLLSAHGAVSWSDGTSGGTKPAVQCVSRNLARLGWDSCVVAAHAAPVMQS